MGLLKPSLEMLDLRKISCKELDVKIESCKTLDDVKTLFEGNANVEVSRDAIYIETFRIEITRCKCCYQGSWHYETKYFRNYGCFGNQKSLLINDYLEGSLYARVIRSKRKKTFIQDKLFDKDGHTRKFNEYKHYVIDYKKRLANIDNKMAERIAEIVREYADEKQMLNERIKNNVNAILTGDGWCR